MSDSHDTLANRLVIILTKLNNGERFTIKELEEEFNITQRTLQKDLNERLSILPIKRDRGYYYLEEYYLGKLNFNDIKNFATLAGIKDLYPALDDKFIKSMLSNRLDHPCLIKNHNYEDLSNKGNDFTSIESAISNKQIVICTYNDKQRVLKPYKLVNKNGIWYLAADENDKLKTYTFSKIKNLSISDEIYIPSKEFEKIIKENSLNWFSNQKIDVTLKIEGKAIEYFLRRKQFAKQEIIEQSKEYLIISTQVSYEEELLQVVKYWIPYMQILSPTTLQDKLIKNLQEYIKTN
jgi:predicted DNA-binding transcriptional regulator YafY